MAAIHTSGSIACFIFGGFILLPSLFVLVTQLNFGQDNDSFASTSEVLFVLIGLGCGLIALGWYIGVLSKN